jgi:hypothetical protein
MAYLKAASDLLLNTQDIQSRSKRGMLRHAGGVIASLLVPWFDGGPASHRFFFFAALRLKVSG